MFYPQTRPKLYFKNIFFKIGSFFKKTVTLPVSLHSSVAYQYTCDCCEQSYIGSTKLQMFYRCSQHCGVSHKTGRHITKPIHLSICEQSYIGSTKLQMFYRCSQHCGVSHRTDQHITKPMHLSVRTHCKKINIIR